MKVSFNGIKTPGAQRSRRLNGCFISSTACNITDLTATADIGYPDMHVIEAVDITD